PGRITHQRRPGKLVRLDRPFTGADVASNGRGHLSALTVAGDEDLRLRAAIDRLADELLTVLDPDRDALGVARLILRRHEPAKRGRIGHVRAGHAVLTISVRSLYCGPGHPRHPPGIGLRVSVPRRFSRAIDRDQLHGRALTALRKLHP